MDEQNNLPTQAVLRCVKDALPEGIMLKKDSKFATIKAATLFVSYATHMAQEHARNRNHKTITGTDVLGALEDMEMEGFREELEQKMGEYKEAMAEKKKRNIGRQLQKAAAKAAAEVEDEGNDEDVGDGKDDEGVSAAKDNEDKDAADPEADVTKSNTGEGGSDGEMDMES